MLKTFKKRQKSKKKLKIINKVYIQTNLIFLIILKDYNVFYQYFKSIRTKKNHQINLKKLKKYININDEY